MVGAVLSEEVVKVSSRDLGRLGGNLGKINLKRHGPVFKYKNFTVISHSGPSGNTLWTVLGPKQGEVLRGNRSSIVDAAVEMDKYDISGGYGKWENVDALIRSNTSYQGMDIDPELREVIKELDVRGLSTCGSCAGHGPDSTGFIAFNKRLLSFGDKLVIKRILSGFGIKVDKFCPSRKGSCTSVDFRGIDGETSELPFWLKG